MSLDSEGRRGVAEVSTAWRAEPRPRAAQAVLTRTDLEALASRMAPGDRGFKYRIVPKATLARRKDGRLSPAESERLARVTRVFDFAVKCFRDEYRAQHFFFGPHMMLEMAWPIDLLLESEAGAREVENVLGGMYYGMAV